MMSLSDAGVRRCYLIALYFNHRLPPWLAEVATRESQPIDRHHRFIQVQVVHPFPSAQKNTQCPSRESYAKGCTFTRFALARIKAKHTGITRRSQFASHRYIFRRGGEHIRQGAPKDVGAAGFFNRAVCVSPRAICDQNRDKHDRAPEAIHVSGI